VLNDAGGRRRSAPRVARRYWWKKRSPQGSGYTPPSGSLFRWSMRRRREAPQERSGIIAISGESPPGGSAPSKKVNIPSTRWAE